MTNLLSKFSKLSLTPSSSKESAPLSRASSSKQPARRPSTSKQPSTSNAQRSSLPVSRELSRFTPAVREVVRDRHEDRFTMAWYSLSQMAIDIGLCDPKDLDDKECIPREKMPDVYDTVKADVRKLDSPYMHWIWVPAGPEENGGWAPAFRTLGMEVEAKTGDDVARKQ